MRPVLLLILAFATLAQQKKAPPKPPPETFIQWLARVTGVSATSSGLKGDITNFSGDIWFAHIDKPGSQRLTFDGSYQWPVFSNDDQSIIAIRDGQIWSVPVTGGDPTKLPHSPKGVTEFIAFGAEGVVMFLGADIGLFKTESGDFVPFKPTTQADRDSIARMRWPTRQYGGGLTVSEKQNGILVEINGEPREISASGERLGQPSVSHDRKLIVYVRHAYN